MRRTHKENKVQENKKDLNEKHLWGQIREYRKESVRKDRAAENGIALSLHKVLQNRRNNGLGLEQLILGGQQYSLQHHGFMVSPNHQGKLNFLFLKVSVVYHRYFHIYNYTSLCILISLLYWK